MRLITAHKFPHAQETNNISVANNINNYFRVFAAENPYRWYTFPRNGIGVSCVNPSYPSAVHGAFPSSRLSLALPSNMAVIFANDQDVVVE